MAVDIEPQTRRRADSRRGNDQADWVWKAPRPDFVRGANEPEDAWHARVNADSQRLMNAYDVHHEPEGGEKEPQRRVRVQREYELSLLLGDKLQGYYKENSSKLGNTDAAKETLQALCDKFAKVQEDKQKQDLRSRRGTEARQPIHKTLSALKALQDRADHGEFYARGTSDQLAQAWVDGDHKTTKYTPSNRRAEEVTRAELISMENAEAKRATGLTIQVVLDDFKRCAEIIKQLGDSVNEEVEAEEAYDAYEDVSDQSTHSLHNLMTNKSQALTKYWSFIRGITDSLSKPGVKKNLGPVYKPLFELNLKTFEVSPHPHSSRIIKKQSTNPSQESSEKFATTIASDLDPEEEHQKEKSPWDLSAATNEDEETYQTEGELSITTIQHRMNGHRTNQSHRNTPRLDRQDQAAPQARSRSYSGLEKFKRYGVTGQNEDTTCMCMEERAADGTLH
jgi:hypothetical protein